MQQELITVLKDVKANLEGFANQSKSASAVEGTNAKKVIAAGIVKQASYARTLAEYEQYLGAGSHD